MLASNVILSEKRWFTIHAFYDPWLLNIPHSLETLMRYHKIAQCFVGFPTGDCPLSIHWSWPVHRNFCVLMIMQTVGSSNISYRSWHSLSVSITLCPDNFSQSSSSNSTSIFSFFILLLSFSSEGPHPRHNIT